MKNAYATFSKKQQDTFTITWNNRKSGLLIELTIVILLWQMGILLEIERNWVEKGAEKC